MSSIDGRPEPRVVEAAIRDLELHAQLFDALGLGADSVVVLHVGSAAGGPRAGLDRFLAGVERLSERARSRLVVENDLALLRLRDQLAERGIATEGGRLVVEDGRAQGPSGKPTTQPVRR
jgi:hypothetical protein